MTNRVDFAMMSTAIDNKVRVQDVERRSSNFRYWLMVPLAGIVIYGSAIWALLALVGPPAGFMSYIRRRLHGRSP